MSTQAPPPEKTSRRNTLWLDDFQRRHRVVGLPIAVFYKFFDDSGPYLAALITYYGFVSLFPLLLLVSTVLSFVLRNNPGLQQDIVNSAMVQIPVVGKQLQDPKQLSGGLGGVLAGLAFAIYGGLGIGQAVQYAMNTAWAVPRNDRPNPLFGRLRSLLLIACVGLVLLATTAVSALSRLFPGELGQFISWLGPAIVVVVDALIFVSIFRHGPSRHLEIRQVVPGAVLAAIGWALLQTYGVQYATHVINRAKASDASGTNLVFATVLGLLAFIYLAGIVTIFCVEINVVLEKKLYPRALLTPFTDSVDLTGGDRRAYTAMAQAARHKGFERIEVTFDQPAPVDPETFSPAELRDAHHVAATDGTPVAHGSSLHGEVHPRGDNDDDPTVPISRRPPQD